MSALAVNANGDQLFQQFYISHLKWVRSLVYTYRFRDAEAEDIIQDIFIKAWRAMSQLQEQGSQHFWLRTITRNHCVSSIRLRAKREDLHLYLDENVEWDQIFVQESDRSRAEHKDELLLEHKISALSYLIEHHQDPLRKQIAKLFYFDGLTTKDIAQKLQLNSNTVLSHLRRFRLIVGRALVKYLEQPQVELG